jgi:hypothetical protein
MQKENEDTPNKAMEMPVHVADFGNLDKCLSKRRNASDT